MKVTCNILLVLNVNIYIYISIKHAYIYIYVLLALNMKPLRPVICREFCSFTFYKKGESINSELQCNVRI